MFMRILLFAFAVPFHLENKNNKVFENNIETIASEEGVLTSEFIYGKEEIISINKIHLDLIRKRVFECLQNKNYSEIQKLIVIEKYMNDYEDKITTTKLENGGLWKDWDIEF